MLTFLTIAVALLAALGALNLGLVLRLSSIVRNMPTMTAEKTDELESGDPLPSVEPGLLKGLSLVGFFTPTCRPCHESLPDFTRAAREVMAAGGQVLSVVRVHDHDDPAETLSSLEGIPLHVINDGDDTAMLDAFRVRAFPTILRSDDGKISHTGYAATTAPVPVPA